jgi:MFS family permease
VLLFSVAFGAMLLSRVLWAQDVWHWSPLTTGLSVAPGPLMVPLFSFLVAGRLTARFGAGPVIAAGSTIFAAGAAWWALAIGAATRLRQRVARRDAADRNRRGPHPADADGNGNLIAAPARIRDRLDGSEHASARSGSPLAWPR